MVMRFFDRMPHKTQVGGGVIIDYIIDEVIVYVEDINEVIVYVEGE